jgi:hypothetical protein
MKAVRFLARSLAAFAAAAVIGGAVASGLAAPAPSPAPTVDPHPQAAEVQWVAAVTKDLQARFPTTKEAVAAGYFRYTNEDSTGAISYANLQWQSADAQHPSQLWYDVKGNLIGADFSVLQSNSMAPPDLWGVNYRRWSSFRQHMHWVLAGPNGTETYGATSAKKWVAAGGSVDSPSADTVVKLGKATSAADVKHVFLFPSLWDLQVWVVPNPNGAFAEKNPNVVPSASAEKDSM